MKTTITITFRDDDAHNVKVLTRSAGLQLLLRDAFGEFIAVREKTANYVAAMYKDQDARFQARKIREVERRILLAETLKRGDVTIEIEP